MNVATFKELEPRLEQDVAEYLGEEPASNRGDRLPILDMRRLDGEPPAERDFVLEGYIPEREVALFTGPGGEGKSLFAQQLATCAAACRDFLGLKTDLGPEGASLYVTCEENEDELERRQRSIMAALNLSKGDVDELLFLSSLRGRIGNELAVFDRDGTLEKTTTYSVLQRAIIEHGATFVILDNVGHLFAGNENDRGQVTRFVNLLYSLTRKHCCTILLIAHPNKSGDNYSGSTAWLNAVRSHIHIGRVRDELGNCHDPDARVLTLGKANYAPTGTELHFRWHRGAFVRDEDLPEDYAAEIARASKAASENTVFLNCLRTRTAQGEGRFVGPQPGPNYAPSQFEGMTEARGLSRATLRRAMERLFEIGAVESHTYRNKAKGRDVTVLREVPQASPNSTPNCSRTLIPNSPEQCARTTPHTHPIPKGIEGAAFGPPAPSPVLAGIDEEQCND